MTPPLFEAHCTWPRPPPSILPVPCVRKPFSDKLPEAAARAWSAAERDGMIGGFKAGLCTALDPTDYPPLRRISTASAPGKLGSHRSSVRRMSAVTAESGPVRRKV